VIPLLSRVISERSSAMGSSRRPNRALYKCPITVLVQTLLIKVSVSSQFCYSRPDLRHKPSAVIRLPRGRRPEAEMTSLEIGVQSQ